MNGVTVTAEVVEQPSVGAQFREMLAPASNIASVQVAAQQAAIQIACQVMAAQATPRNEAAIRHEFLLRAQDINFAETAFYAVPRGDRDEDAKTDDKKDGKVRGPSVHLARELLGRWQHVNVEVTDHGKYTTTIDGKKETYSDIEIQAWDIQNNSKFTMKFKVRHWRYRSAKNGGGYALDGNQAEEVVLAISAKKERNAILKFVPRSFINELKKACDATIAAAMANKATVELMLDGFKTRFKVNQVQLEEYIGKPLGEWDREDLVEMAGVMTGLKTGEQKVEDYFTEAVPEAKPMVEKLAEATARIKKDVETKLPEKPPEKPADPKSTEKPAPADTTTESQGSDTKASEDTQLPANAQTTAGGRKKAAGKTPGSDETKGSSTKKASGKAETKWFIAYLEENGSVYSIANTAKQAAELAQDGFEFAGAELHVVECSDSFAIYMNTFGGDTFDRDWFIAGLGTPLPLAMLREEPKPAGKAQDKPADKPEEKPASTKPVPEIDPAKNVFDC